VLEGFWWYLHNFWETEHFFYYNMHKMSFFELFCRATFHILGGGVSNSQPPCILQWIQHQQCYSRCQILHAYYYFTRAYKIVLLFEYVTNRNVTNPWQTRTKWPVQYITKFKNHWYRAYWVAKKSWHVTLTRRHRHSANNWLMAKYIDMQVYHPSTSLSLANERLWTYMWKITLLIYIKILEIYK